MYLISNFNLLFSEVVILVRMLHQAGLWVGERSVPMSYSEKPLMKYHRLPKLCFHALEKSPLVLVVAGVTNISYVDDYDNRATKMSL